VTNDVPVSFERTHSMNNLLKLFHFKRCDKPIPNDFFGADVIGFSTKRSGTGDIIYGDTKKSCQLGSVLHFNSTATEVQLPSYSCSFFSDDTAS
jgi:hypothetical protein